MDERSRRRSTHAADSSICSLCRRQHSQLLSPEEWKNVAACAYILSDGLSIKSQICYACKGEIPRLLSCSTYIPRWKRVSTRREASGRGACVSVCSVLKCNEQSLSSTSLGNMDEVRQALQQLWLKCSDSIPVPTPPFLRENTGFEAHRVLSSSVP